jgi:hypothetical protein
MKNRSFQRENRFSLCCHNTPFNSEVVVSEADAEDTPPSGTWPVVYFKMIKQALRLPYRRSACGQAGNPINVSAVCRLLNRYGQLFSHNCYDNHKTFLLPN